MSLFPNNSSGSDDYAAGDSLRKKKYIFTTKELIATMELNEIETGQFTLYFEILEDKQIFIIAKGKMILER